MMAAVMVMMITLVCYAAALLNPKPNLPPWMETARRGGKAAKGKDGRCGHEEGRETSPVLCPFSQCPASFRIGATCVEWGTTASRMQLRGTQRETSMHDVKRNPHVYLHPCWETAYPVLLVESSWSQNQAQNPPISRYVTVHSLVYPPINIAQPPLMTIVYTISACLCVCVRLAVGPSIHRWHRAAGPRDKKRTHRPQRSQRLSKSPH